MEIEKRSTVVFNIVHSFRASAIASSSSVRYFIFPLYTFNLFPSILLASQQEFHSLHAFFHCFFDTSKYFFSLILALFVALPVLLVLCVFAFRVQRTNSYCYHYGKQIKKFHIQITRNEKHGNREKGKNSFNVNYCGSLVMDLEKEHIVCMSGASCSVYPRPYP